MRTIKPNDYRYHLPQTQEERDRFHCTLELAPIELELLDVLSLVVAEWESDPSSVACFDLSTVQRGKNIVARYRRALRK